MRPFALLLSVAVPLAAAGAACKDKGDSKNKAGESSTSESGARPASAPRPATIAPLTVDEVRPLIPALSHALPIGRPGSLSAGRQVKAVYCVAGAKSSEAVADEVVAALQKLGFVGVSKRAHPRTPEVLRVNGEKTPYRVGATIERGPYPDCPVTAGKIKVIFSYFKRVAIPAGGSSAPVPPSGGGQ